MPMVTRHGLAAALLCACAASSAHAQTNRISANLSWDHCVGDGRIADRTFACNTNSGIEVLVLSMVLHDSTRTGVGAWSARIDVTPVAATVPPWWGFDVGMCRPNRMATQLDWSQVPTPPTTCLPWYGTSPIVGVSAFTYGAPDRFHLEVQAAVPPDQVRTLLAGQEYQLCGITISHASTVGTGACEGCTVPACIGVSQLDLVYSGRPRDYFAGSGLNAVTWQGGYVASYPERSGQPCSHPSLCPYTNQLQCTTPPVPAGRHTSGLIKTLYR